MEAQSADAVLLVRPAAFGYNAEAAKTNVFSRASQDSDFARHTAAEFDALAKTLSDSGVETLILEDSPDPPKPDAVFPNNWFSTHADGTIVLYPMATAPRRLERRVGELKTLLVSRGFRVERILDLSENEQQGHFLEGTGSLVLDRPNREAYANRSPRTDARVVAEFDEALGYSTFLFDAHDRRKRAIYHTNVLLSLGTDFAVLCSEAVAPSDREPLIARIEGTGRTIIDLDFKQLRCFGCNLLELRGKAGPVIILSAKAISSLTSGQQRALGAFGNVLAVAVPTIEAVGGGSVRCMIAEIHLPRVSSDS